MKDRWPALFDPSQKGQPGDRTSDLLAVRHVHYLLHHRAALSKFQRTTTVHLEPNFMSALDHHTPKLLTLFHAKGGALGRRLENRMEPLQESVYSSVERTREVVLQCLVEYLGEHVEHFGH
ncbi:uncharacterized protein LOC143335962 [Chaetodon auriga]|uniref:uncharacterized protein LOC143335962 n=1 Tax=Chaetodon auriga TaxID=39042 RepID=UPI004032E93C